jgi:WD40 repeat protein
VADVKQIRVYSLPGGKEIALRGDYQFLSPQLLQYTLDGRLIVPGAKSISMWNPTSDKSHFMFSRRFGNKDPIRTDNIRIGLSKTAADGHRIIMTTYQIFVIGSDNKTICEFEILPGWASGDPAVKGPLLVDPALLKRAKEVESLANAGKIVRDGSEECLIARIQVGGKAVLKVWRLRDLAEVAMLPNIPEYHDRFVSCSARRLFASWSSRESAVSIWSVARGSEVARLRGHIGQVSSVTFANNSAGDHRR